MAASNSVPSSGTTTPINNTPTQIHELQHHKHTHHSLKQIWRDIKSAAAEHHRSVNEAYISYYGQGMTRVG